MIEAGGRRNNNKHQAHWLRTLPFDALKTALIFTPITLIQKSLYHSEFLGSTTLSARFPNAYLFFDVFAKVQDHIFSVVSGIIPEPLHINLYSPSAPGHVIKFPFFPHVFTASILEEAFWRGMIQKTLMKKIATVSPVKIKSNIEHPATRIFISATFFSLLHMYQWRILPEGPFSTFLRGLWYGYLAEYTGLKTAIAIHFLWNIYSFKVL